MTASQDYRDGAVTGASQLAKRIKVLHSYGISLNNPDLDDLVVQLGDEWGGSIDQEQQ